MKFLGFTMLLTLFVFGFSAQVEAQAKCTPAEIEACKKICTPEEIAQCKAKMQATCASKSVQTTNANSATAVPVAEKSAVKKCSQPCQKRKTASATRSEAKAVAVKDAL